MSEAGTASGLPRGRCIQLPASGRLARLSTMDPAPRLIWLAGEVPTHSQRWLGVWGTRTPSDAGVVACLDLVAGAARAGWDCVVTGLAPGIDEIAASAALDGGLPVVAVVPGGVDVAETESGLELRDRIAHGNGVVLSVEDPGTDVTLMGRLRRNELQALLCDAAVLVESEAQGGAVHCARMALHHGRSVALLDEPLGDLLPGAYVTASAVTALRVVG